MKSTLTTMTLSLTGIALAVGAILGVVHYATEKPIEQAVAKAKDAAMGEILPPFDSYAAGETNSEGLTLYTATKDRQPVGYAVDAYSDNGFGGRISIVAGFDTTGVLTGYRVMSHAETPGLGAKMDEWFRESGTGHDVIGSSAPLKVTKDGGDVDAITGATITSRAFAEAINKAREALPLKR